MSALSHTYFLSLFQKYYYKIFAGSVEAVSVIHGTALMIAKNLLCINKCFLDSPRQQISILGTSTKQQCPAKQDLLNHKINRK